MARQSDVLTKGMTITAETQAERLNSLVMMSGLNGHSPMKFNELVVFLKETEGITISKSTWHAMRNEDYKVVKIEILHGVASFFKVDKEFLSREEAPAPEGYDEYRNELLKKQSETVTEAFFRHASKLTPKEQSEMLVSFQHRMKKHLSLSSQS